MESSSDRIIRTIHDFIANERQRSFSFLGTYSHLHMRQQDLLVLSSASLDDVETARGLHKNRLSNFTDSQFFIFIEPMGSVGRLVIVTASEETDIERMTVQQVMTSCSKTGNTIRCDNLGSISASAWIRETYTLIDDARMKQSEMQYEEQRLWWDGIPKAFNLRRLPAELREAIYLQAIGGPVIVPDLHQGRVVLGHGLAYQERHCGKNRDPGIAAPNMSIMRLSKQVRSEATAVAHSDTFKRMRMVGAWDSSPLVPVFRNLSPQGTFLRNIQLEMSAARYFAFINIVPVVGTPFQRKQASGFGFDALRTFGGLQNLDLRFISPKHPDAECPWALLLPRGPNPSGEHSCQKTWIDWWFTLAWSRLKALQNSQGVRYTLSGCVKTSSKQYWERALADKANSYSASTTAKVTQIQQGKTDDLPIPCHCSNPCSTAGSGQVHTYDEYDQRHIEGLKEHLDDVYWDFRD